MSWLHTKRPIVINADLATHVGLNEAIILQQLNYWIDATDSGVDHDGMRWIYNTQDRWREQFPFWSLDTVKRGFASLKKQGLIHIQQLAKQKHDRTNYYAIDHAKLDEMEAQSRAIAHKCKMPSSSDAESADPSGQEPPVHEGNMPPSNGATCPDVTEITTETTAETTADTLSGQGADAPEPALEGEYLGAEENPGQPEQQSEPKTALERYREHASGPKDEDCKTFKAWANYAIAYEKVYSVWPLWNRTTAGQMGHFIDKVGAESAPKLAAHYLKLKDRAYLQSSHDVALMLRDAQAINTSYHNGRAMNGTIARQMEAQEANLSAAAQIREQQAGQEVKPNAFLR